MKVIFTLIGIFLFIINLNCQNVKVFDYDSAKLIGVGMGPEDMAVDYTSSIPRLIVSCGNWRKHKKPNREAGFYSVNTSTGVSTKMDIQLGKENVHVIPQGISFVPGNPSLLYVVNKGLTQKRKEDNAIIVFIVNGNTLQLDTIIRSAEFRNPNDICALGDSSFYVTNAGGAVFRKKSNLVYYNPKERTVKVVFNEPRFANGVHVANRTLFLTDTYQKILRVFNVAEDGSLQKIRDLPVPIGMDNILPNQENTKLYLASHDSKFKFALAFLFKKYRSPFTLHQLDVATKQVEEIPCHGEPGIGAVSSCVIVNDDLYLSQVYDCFILRLKPMNQLPTK